MNNTMRLKSAYNYLEAPYIRVEATITQPGITNGKPNIYKKDDYIVAPSAKKVATYIVNQIFGSDLTTQTEGLSINWLMPTLKKSLELAVYEEESFILINKFDNKKTLKYFKDKVKLLDDCKVFALPSNSDRFRLAYEFSKIENSKKKIR